MKTIIVTGPPYSGKGTQCEILEKELGYYHLSTGEALRAEEEAGTDLGALTAPYSDAGEYVPDDVMKMFLAGLIEKNADKRGLILDGYPRTVPQVDTLLELGAENGLEFTHVINLNVEKEELLARANNRAKNSTREDDKDVKKHYKRIEKFQTSTIPAIEYLGKKMTISQINGMAGIEETTASIREVISKKNSRTDVNSLGEFGLIEHLTRKFPLRHASSVKGIGDDAAVVDNGNKVTVVSTDILAEGIHFDLMYAPLKHLGYKSVVVNLSDIYAMNAIPKQITYSIAISNRFSVEALEELYAGIEAACNHYNVDLVGGDTTSSLKGLFISVTAIGEGEKDKLVYRNGAKPGDILCVTGDLGAAYLGLQILEREKQIYLSSPGVQPDLGSNDYVIGRQLKPEARKDMIEQFIPKAGFVPTSMIDISDGLASEIFHLCRQSQVGMIVNEAGVPIRPDVQELAINFKLDPITCALSGGEDYELLFTVSPDDLEKVRYMPDIYICGEVVDKSEGINLHTKGGNIHQLKAQGWVHF